MKLFRKSGDKVELLIYPHENIRKGDYISIKDRDKDLSLLIQVIDITYIDAPGILEELIREGILENTVIVNGDLMDVGRASVILKDTRLAIGVIRGTITGGNYSHIYLDLPSRAFSRVSKVSTSDVLKIVNNGSIDLPVYIGEDSNGSPIKISSRGLDGCLTLITGMKGVGKSHLAKLIAMNLIRYGAPVLIFDLNGEYLGLMDINGVELLEGGVNLWFTLEYLGRETVLDILVNVLGLPGVSANMFNEVWESMKRRGYEITIDNLINFISLAVKNMMIKDALISRLMILSNARFIVSEKSKLTRIEDILARGKGFIINLKSLSSIERRILVEIFLSKLVELLERKAINPLFLFAEEAHLYIRDTYWEDIITRMRHFGLFVIFITNQPDTLKHEVFRQLDNLFIFRFMNEKDLDMLSRISNIDGDTVKSIARDLDRGQVLIVGEVVKWMPIVANVSPISFDPMGETRRVFNS